MWVRQGGSKKKDEGPSEASVCNNLADPCEGNAPYVDILSPCNQSAGDILLHSKLRTLVVTTAESSSVSVPGLQSISVKCLQAAAMMSVLLFDLFES